LSKKLKMNVETLSQYLEKLEKTTSRNEITAILADLFAQASAEEIDKICYLLLGRLAPGYRSIEFNLAEKMMIKVLAFAFSKTEQEIRKKFKQLGDLGDIAFPLSNTDSASNLSVTQLHQRLLKIAQQAGSGSQERKIKLLAQLINQSDNLSNKYLVRIPIGKLRLGFSDITILDALSWMKTKDKSLRPALEKAYNISADIGLVAKTFKKGGLRAIQKIKPQTGIPIRPALTERLPTAEKIIEKMGQPAVEPKYDGFRVQIHLDRDRRFGKEKTALFNPHGCFVRIFSRRLENTTPMFPEIVAAAQKLPVQSAILDGEAIGIDPKTGKFLPFQETAQRKRKYQVAQAAKEIPLKVYVFDLLYLNGQPLLDQPLSRRRRQLESCFNVLIHRNKVRQKRLVLQLTPQKVVTDPKTLDQLFHYWVKRGLEGIVCKKTNSPYRAGKREFTWVKYKRAMKSHLADTVDCLVMGYYRGRGKRSGFGIGAFLVGIWHPKKEAFVTIAKIGTGLTDDQWRKIRQKVDQTKTVKRPKEYQVPKELIPDVWTNPEVVVEIEADEITKSPLHTSKFALRFPRMQRFRDKKPTDVTALPEIKELFKMQQH